MTSLRTRLTFGYILLVVLLVFAGWLTLSSSNRLLPLVLLAVCILINGIFVITIARGIIRPLDALARSAQQIQSGNLEPKVDVSGDAEISRLGKSFNAMAKTLLIFRRDEEARLHRSQETTRTAINSLPHAVAVLSPAGQIELANELAERLFGIKPGALLQELPHKWLNQMVNTAAAQKAPVEPKGFDAAIQVFDKTRELFFLPHAIPLLNAKQELVGTTVLLVDATELRQIDEAKSGLISSVSHELKTPLTSIQMAIHLVLDDAAARLTPRELELLQAARDDADRLHELIGSLLDAGRRKKPE